MKLWTRSRRPYLRIGGGGRAGPGLGDDHTNWFNTPKKNSFNVTGLTYSDVLGPDLRLSPFLPSPLLPRPHSPVLPHSDCCGSSPVFNPLSLSPPDTHILLWSESRGSDTRMTTRTINPWTPRPQLQRRGVLWYLINGSRSLTYVTS